MSVTFRLMTLPDLRRTLDWAAEERWNPGLDDAEAFMAADPEGFFLAEHDGQPVASISVVNHSDNFAFLGLYICRPAFRGRGIGFALWQHAIAHAGSRTIGLDGVPAQQDNYRKSGFVDAGATLRFEGDIGGSTDAEIRPADRRDFAALIDMEQSASGSRKQRFLETWLEGCASRSTLVLAPGNRIEGFATVRRCRRDVKIGPVIADGAGAAIRLIRAAAARFGTGAAIVDVPGDNGDLIAELAGRGMQMTFPTARMYRGPQPTKGNTLQAVSTLELG